MSGGSTGPGASHLGHAAPSSATGASFAHTPVGICVINLALPSCQKFNICDADYARDPALRPRRRGGSCACAA